MHRQFRALLLLPILVFFPWQISHGKNIQRSCSAYYEFTVRDMGFRSQSPPAVGQAIRGTFGNFNAAGSCGRTVPNKCRQRARNAAHTCMSHHWGNPPNMEGYVCSNIPDYSLGAQGLYLQGTFRDLLCRTFRADEITVNVRAITTGDKDCGKTATLATGYRVVCN